MEVKEASAVYLRTTGYKQTEVGVIPEDWDVVPLSALCRSICDGTHFTPHYVSQGIPFYSVENVTANDFSNTKFISESEHMFLVRRCKPERGDILMTRIGSLGDTKLLNWDVNASIYVSLALLKPSERTHPEYLYRYSKSKAFVLDVEKRSLLNATPKKINMGEIGSIPIPVPQSKAEQEAIAEALSDADALIEFLEQLLAKKRHLKQGARQELLTGKKRLPGFIGGWEVKRLGEIAHIKTGSRNNQDKVEDGEYPFFVRSATVEQINCYSYDCEAILVPGEGGIGSIFHYIHGRFDVHQRVYAITQFAPNVSGKYMYLYMTVHFGAHAMQNSVKATVDSLRLPTFQEFEITLPPSEEEQTAIATILSDMDAEIAALEEKLAKVRNIKQGMMQELLTGRIRLVGLTSSADRTPLARKSVSSFPKSHNWQINEAVVISVLAKRFGSENRPLGRKRYTKLAYLLHRYVEKQAEGYLKKAAGPYNPATKYKGPEAIALKNRYVRLHSREKFSGFIAAEKIGEAENYFSKWYGEAVLTWLEQFRYKSNDELEVLATVDMALVELRRGGEIVGLGNVKQIIQDHPEWKSKLDRASFSDESISLAIALCRRLFTSEESD